MSKKDLAQHFRRAAMLCYPCKYYETSCHVALEGMAAGCLVSTTTAGALPETTGGFAWLTPAAPGYQLGAFIRKTLDALDERDRHPVDIEARLRLQMAHVQRHHAPALIAAQWCDFLRSDPGENPLPR